VGHYCYYQAMPEKSSLFRRLRSELPIRTLYDGLLHNPAGPYDTGKLTVEELDEILDALAQDDAFGSRAALVGVMDALQAELKSAASAWPGLEDRAAYMKMHHDFLGTLVEQFTRLGHPAAETLATDLLHGVRPLASSSFGTHASRLSLVSAEMVTEAARWIGGIAPQAFAEWWGEDFPQWQRAYLKAAENGEAIVIGCG
jgi:hypothetical protein